MKLYILALALLLSACLTMPTPEPTVTPSPTETVTPTERAVAGHTETHTQTCTVATGIPDGDLNLRTGAGTEYAVIATLTEGTTVRVLETKGTWYRVHVIEAINGWINGRYCE